MNVITSIIGHVIDSDNRHQPPGLTIHLQYLNDSTEWTDSECDFRIPDIYVVINVLLRDMPFHFFADFDMQTLRTVYKERSNPSLVKHVSTFGASFHVNSSSI